MKTERSAWWGPLKERLKNGALKQGGRPPGGLDMVLNALFFRVRNAGAWRDLPEIFGPWRMIYGWYQRLARQGIWERRLGPKTGSDWSMARMWWCTHAPPIPPEEPRSRRWAALVADAGRNTKLMELTDDRGLPVMLLLIEGQAYEGRCVIPLLEEPEGLLVVGDKGFDGNPLPQQLEQLGASHCIPSKSNRLKKRRFNKKLYRQRCKVNNYFCRLKH